MTNINKDGNFEYNKIEGYNPILLKFYLKEAMKVLNLSPSLVRNWINNGFEIAEKDLFVEVREMPRKRLKGYNYEIIVYFKVFIQDESGDGYMDDEIQGRFLLNEYDRVSECVAYSLFKINLISTLQNCSNILNTMSEDENREITSIDDIDDFIENEEHNNDLINDSLYD